MPLNIKQCRQKWGRILEIHVFYNMFCMILNLNSVLARWWCRAKTHLNSSTLRQFFDTYLRKALGGALKVRSEHWWFSSTTFLEYFLVHLYSVISLLALFSTRMEAQMTTQMILRPTLYSTWGQPLIKKTYHGVG